MLIWRLWRPLKGPSFSKVGKQDVLGVYQTWQSCWVRSPPLKVIRMHMGLYNTGAFVSLYFMMLCGKWVSMGLLLLQLPSFTTIAGAPRWWSIFLKPMARKANLFSFKTVSHLRGTFSPVSHSIFQDVNRCIILSFQDRSASHVLYDYAFSSSNTGYRFCISVEAHLKLTRLICILQTCPQTFGYMD